MKKILLAALCALALTGCSAPVPETEIESPNCVDVKPAVYVTSGRYYIINDDLQGQVVTADGNVWNYTQDIISNELAYNNEPVFAVMLDNCTPDIIEDDIVKGVMLDRETAIYDALEVAFSNTDGFSTERAGNNIKISIED